jgi:VWFA-related protein
MVLITDGEDNGSIVKVEDAIKTALQADAVIYAIQYTALNMGRGWSVLEKISKATGGRAYQVTQSMSLESIFKGIEDEMRNQYGLGYPSPSIKQDGAFHRLEVKVITGGLIVQARSGYYSASK